MGHHLGCAQQRCNVQRRGAAQWRGCTQRRGGELRRSGTLQRGTALGNCWPPRSGLYMSFNLLGHVRELVRGLLSQAEYLSTHHQHYAAGRPSRRK